MFYIEAEDESKEIPADTGLPFGAAKKSTPQSYCDPPARYSG